MWVRAREGSATRASKSRSQTSLAGLKINKGVLLHDYVHATHLYTKGKAEVGRMRVQMGRDEENMKATCRYAAETSR